MAYEPVHHHPLEPGINNLVLGLTGDTSVLDIDLIKSLDIVEDVKRIREPYKNANRKFQSDDLIVDVAEPGSAADTLRSAPAPAPSDRRADDAVACARTAGDFARRGI